MIWLRISATEAKSSPKQGLATISTSTSPLSSRASTARCTLPPESVSIGASGPWVFTRYLAISSLAFSRIGPGDIHQPSLATGGLSNERNARFSATLIRGTVAFFSGSSGSPNTL
ncbi:hypothetical protein D3C87_1881810 [compost metagenome]